MSFHRANGGTENILFGREEHVPPQTYFRVTSRSIKAMHACRKPTMLGNNSILALCCAYNDDAC